MYVYLPNASEKVYWVLFLHRLYWFNFQNLKVPNEKYLNWKNFIKSMHYTHYIWEYHTVIASYHLNIEDCLYTLDRIHRMFLRHKSTVARQRKKLGITGIDKFRWILFLQRHTITSYFAYNTDCTTLRQTISDCY